MRQLEAVGDYFSDEEMKRRDPLLYEDMIGQHLTDDDAKAMLTVDESMKDHALSEVLLQHIQVMQNNELYDRLKDAEVFMYNNLAYSDNHKLYCKITGLVELTDCVKCIISSLKWSRVTCLIFTYLGCYAAAAVRVRNKDS